MKRYICKGCKQELTDKQYNGMVSKDIGCPYCNANILMIRVNKDFKPEIRPAATPGTAKEKEKIAKKPAEMWLASWETRHFDFTAIGKTRAECIQILAHGWCRHCATYGGDPDYFTQYVEDVNFTKISLGDCLRDGEKI